MVNVPKIVKDLRARLGLTQEQLAHEVGVTFSSVNQWENGRRRPQPFLLRKLLEMAAALAEGSARQSAAGWAPAFHKRWEIVNAAEREELASTPMILKFQQLEALLISARQFGWTKAQGTKEAQGLEHWSKLRKVCHA
jgi:transcriptional regulator with XRE-family HTH domain